MRRGGNSLLLLGLALVLVLLIGAAAYYYLVVLEGGQGVGGNATLPPPTLPTQEVVHAGFDIARGTFFSNTEQLDLKGIPGDVFELNKAEYFTSLDDVAGLKTSRSFSAGDVLSRSDLQEAGLADRIPTPAAGQEPVRAYSIQVSSLGGVAGQVQAGDFIDVLASFNMDVVTLRPGGILTPTESVSGTVLFEQVQVTTSEGTTKVLLQDIEVLDILEEVVPEGTPTAAPAPTEGPTSQAIQQPLSDSATGFQPGNTVLIIAVTSQEAEILRLVQDRGIGLSVLLRGTGDHTNRRTVGATLQILARLFGMPLPTTFDTLEKPLQNLPSQPLEEYLPVVPTPTATATATP